LGVIVDHSRSRVDIIAALHLSSLRKIPDLPNAAVYALTQSDSFITLTALDVVSKSGDKRIVPFVMALLDDSSPEVRKSAAVSLAKLGESKSLPFLKAKYRNEKIPETRDAIKRAISALTGYQVSESEILKG
jgi:HEAT repeat protein